MSETYIPIAIRRKVAKYRCGYCLTQELIIGQPMTIEHIIPESEGGSSDEENLWQSCRRCNECKGNRMRAIDPFTETNVPLFNPRTQRWDDHFEWQEQGVFIGGLTPIGRATVVALRLNNDYIVRSRRRWVAVGWHPPSD